MAKRNNEESIIKEYGEKPSVLKSQLFAFYSEQGYRTEDCTKYAEELCNKVKGQQVRDEKAKKALSGK